MERKHMRRVRLDNRGFGLIDSMFSIGIIGLAAAASLSLTDSVAQSQKHISRKMEFSDVQRQMKSTLQDSNICKQNFASGFNVPVSNPASLKKTYKQIGFYNDKNIWTQIVVVDGAEGSTFTPAKSITVDSLKKVDDDNYIGRLVVEPTEASKPAAPAVFNNFQVKLDPSTRAQAVRAMESCSVSFAFAAAEFKGVALSSTENVSSIITQTIPKNILAGASGVNLKSTCTIRASSGQTEVYVSFYSGAQALVPFNLCSAAGTDNSETRTIQTTKFVRLPEKADSMKINFQLSSSGVKRIGSVDMQWFQ